MRSTPKRKRLRKSQFLRPRLEQLERREMLSGEPVMLRDMNLTPRGSVPQQFVEVDGVAFFTASDAATGRELWKSDGTETGTVLVKDLLPGPDDFNSLRNFRNFNGNLFFWAREPGTSRAELWKSDGTESGTVRIEGMKLGYDCEGWGLSERGSDFEQVGDTLYFRADDGLSKCALWKTDGTETGTVRVGDVRSGEVGPYPYYYPYYLTNVEGTLFFASQWNGGAELWTSDGTQAGSELVKDFGRDTHRFLFDLTSVDGDLFFMSYAWDGAYELWRSNGTESGTVRVKEIAPTPSRLPPSNFTVADGVLFFTANDGVAGQELWTSNGTETGTFRVKDISEGETSSEPEDLTIVNGSLFFTADDGVSGRELWTSDGTEAGTVRVRDIDDAPSSSSPTDLTVLNGLLYFAADDGLNGTELWQSDGSETGTVRIAEIVPGEMGSRIEGIVNINGTLFFSADDGQTERELWRSDGTQSGTVRVKDIWEGTSGSSMDFFVRPFVELNGDVYFRADDFETSDIDIWKTDGTTAETVGAVDAWPDDPNFFPGGISNVNGQLLFFGRNFSVYPNQHELWKSDGTQTGSGIVKDLEASRPVTATVFDDTLYYFTLKDGEYAVELWKSNGTAAGTVFVKDIHTGRFRSYPSDFVDARGTLFFTALDDTDVRKLWKTDGTANGTVRVKDIRPLPVNSSERSLIAVGSIVFFAAHDSLNGLELWRSDGTEEGTYLVKDIVPGPTNSSPANRTNVDGTLYFTVRGELWKSDGTESGTVLVRNLRPGLSGRNPQDLTNIGGTLFLNAWDDEAGVELWKSDGTEAGTVRVKDISPGANAPVARNFTDVNGTLFFVTDDGESGFELWKSDGTEAGTVQVKDIWPGVLSSDPNRLTSFAGTLYFTADDGYHGFEPWVLHPPVGDFDRNHYLNARDIDLMFAAVGSGEHDPAFDLTGDSVVNGDDVSHLVETILGSHFGDANLDGAVDRADVAVVVRNFGRADSPGWADGDFNGDDVVNLLDLMLVQANLTAGVAAAPQAIVAASVRTKPTATPLRSAVTIAVTIAVTDEAAAAVARDPIRSARALEGSHRANAEFSPHDAHATRLRAGPIRRGGRIGGAHTTTHADAAPPEFQPTLGGRSRAVSR